MEDTSKPVYETVLVKDEYCEDVFRGIGLSQNLRPGTIRLWTTTSVIAEQENKDGHFRVIFKSLEIRPHIEHLKKRSFTVCQ